MFLALQNTPYLLPRAGMQKGEGRRIGREKNHETGMSKKGDSTDRMQQPGAKGKGSALPSSQKDEKG